MFTAYKKFWTNYVNFTGRTSRSDYWWAALCNFLIVFPFSFTAMSILYSNYIDLVTKSFNTVDPSIDSSFVENSFSLYSVDVIILLVLVILFGLAVLLPNIAISVRRLRDAGFHWSLIFVPVGALVFSLLGLVPFLRAIVSIIVWFAMIFYYILLCQPTKPYQAPTQPVQPVQTPNFYQEQAAPQQQQPAAQPTAPAQPQAPTDQQQ